MQELAAIQALKEQQLAQEDMIKRNMEESKVSTVTRHTSDRQMLSMNSSHIRIDDN